MCVESSIHTHSFVKFDATRIFCAACGEFRVAPYEPKYTPDWTYRPQVYPNTPYWFTTTSNAKTAFTTK